MRKRITMLLLAVMLAFSSTQAAFADSVNGSKAAGILNALGLFSGVGTDPYGQPIFDLDREPTRQEAMVMLIRLLGLEQTALSQEWEHPFDDVAPWADRYIGYAYNIGLTKGISQNKFGANDRATSDQYIVFLLRALEYSEEAGDFNYADAKNEALGIGLSGDGYDLFADDFTRGDVALLSYYALLLNPKEKQESLANILLWDDVFSTKQLDDTLDGKLMIAADMPDLINNRADNKYVTVYNLDDLRDLILLSMRNDQQGIRINIPGFTDEEIAAVYNDIIKDYHWKAILFPVASVGDDFIYAYINISDYLMLEYYYENPGRYQKNYQFYRTDSVDSDPKSDFYIPLKTWVSKVDGIVKKNTTDSMSQKEKVKALHDYLVLHTVYDKQYEENENIMSHFAQQVIFNGYGVCDGYSEAFKILMNAAGIECKVIYGNSPDGLHAWNQVKIDDVWYNIDVTWDDPDSGNRIMYNYFCKSDSVFKNDHWPEEICHAEKCPKSI